jgi:hypothetical protein
MSVLETQFSWLDTVASSSDVMDVRNAIMLGDNLEEA